MRSLGCLFIKTITEICCWHIAYGMQYLQHILSDGHLLWTCGLDYDMDQRFVSKIKITQLDYSICGGDLIQGPYRQVYLRWYNQRYTTGRQQQYKQMIKSTRNESQKQDIQGLPEWIQSCKPLASQQTSAQASAIWKSTPEKLSANIYYCQLRLAGDHYFNTKKVRYLCDIVPERVSKNSDWQGQQAWPKQN